MVNVLHFGASIDQALLAAVVRGLIHLHDERKILHRDIKAGNVLLSGAAVDGGIKCDAVMMKYLKARFSLSKGDVPHTMTF